MENKILEINACQAPVDFSMLLALIVGSVSIEMSPAQWFQYKTLVTVCKVQRAIKDEVGGYLDMDIPFVVNKNMPEDEIRVVCKDEVVGRIRGLAV